MKITLAKTKTVCFFGLYNKNYARNSSLRDGLLQNGVKVIEVQLEVPNERMELPEDFTLQKTAHRLIRKVGMYIKLLSQWRTVMRSDAVFVLHPGHLDVPFAWILCKLGRKPLYFDTSISPYDTMFVGRSIAERNSPKARLVKIVEKTLLSMCDKLFTDTQLMKDFMVQEFGFKSEKIFVVPLGANDALYKPKPKKSEKVLTVFFFGLYNPLHGANVIMEAIRKLQKETQVRFVMLGDGYLNPELMAFAEKHKLTNVAFKGFVPEKELVTEIQKADILLGVFSNSPIFQRQIPNKVFAALACRKPLITARQKPLEEYLEHKKDIYYCEPENPTSLVQAIKTVVTNNDLRQEIAENGYLVYQQTFTPRTIGETLCKNIFTVSLEKPSIYATTYASILANFQKPQTKAPACPPTIFGYTLRTQIQKKQKLNNFAIGIYEKHGKKYFIKVWHKSEKDLAYYGAINGFRVNQLLHTKLVALSSRIYVPQAIEVLALPDGSVAFVFEHVEGMDLSRYSDATQAKYLEKIITELHGISQEFTAEEKSYFNQRRLFYYLISLLFLAFITVKANRKQVIKIAMACVRCLASARPQKTLTLAHRDLHAQNVKLRNNEIVLLDTEDMVLTIPGFDKADLNLMQAELNEESSLRFLKLYIALHRAGNKLREKHYKQFLFA